MVLARGHISGEILTFSKLGELLFPRIIGTVRFRVAKSSLEIHISSFNVGLGRTTFKLDISGQEYS